MSLENLQGGDGGRGGGIQVTDRLICMISFKVLNLFNHYGSTVIFTQVFKLYKKNNLKAEKIWLPETFYHMAQIKLFLIIVIRKIPWRPHNT